MKPKDNAKKDLDNKLYLNDTHTHIHMNAQSFKIIVSLVTTLYRSKHSIYTVVTTTC